MNDEKTAVVLINLGTPSSPTPMAVKNFLKVFLSDSRVIKKQGILWQTILRFIILPLRSKKVSLNYKKIFIKDTSPLIYYTNLISDKLRDVLPKNMIVKFAMSYSSPNLSFVLNELSNKNVTKLILLPLYPQFSGTTTATCFDAVGAFYKNKNYIPKMVFINEYCSNPLYIKALANKIRCSWDKNKKGQKLLLSFHGLPQKYCDEGDPYYIQCEKTVKMLSSELGILSNDELIMTFQSRFGKQKWLQPYTDKVLASLPAKGIIDIDIICPGFSCDCLETLEEIDILNRQIFLNSGGKKYNYINCSNDDSDIIDLYATLINENNS